MPDTAFERHYVAVNDEDRSLSLQRDVITPPDAGEVLIEVAAAGLNRADLLQRAGLYPPPEDASPIMGLEVAGTVIAVGEDVTNWSVGDPICALTHGGGYATKALAPIGQCFPVPSGYTMEQAAALPEALLTVWHNIFQRGAMQPGEKVLVHGGASGIGTLGIQMAKAMGGEVYTTAGTDQKCTALLELGATMAINYRDEDFEEALTNAGVSNQINVILDMIGGDYVQKNINVAAPDGRIVNIAFMNGFQAEVNFAPLLIKRISLTGSTLRAQSFAQKTIMTAEIIEHIYPHLETGAIKPVVDRVFELSAVASAHDYMQSGAHMGKIILRS
ncbi:NAD(P)H-quinone oxidoreductase [Halioglobus maricola]|uniref:NAD(P)H-quinone oxidoreductase n=1 Tax=Halioglobus maricola TaxID=2601894 RepID=A0A5P9NNL7_9GAMM|nr:NAD(P)H-quinone oxidoreductase [Halioglobus maricola]QFU77430.1 NAD(P)H-quinone oxidoreductase [Halioglobus maricola]